MVYVRNGQLHEICQLHLWGKLAKGHKKYKLNIFFSLFCYFLFLVTQIQQFSVSYVASFCNKYTGVVVSPYPDQEGNKLMFLSEWREIPSAPCLSRKNLMTARVWILLKSRASLTCFLACFLPGRAKDLSAPQFVHRKISTLTFET